MNDFKPQTLRSDTQYKRIYYLDWLRVMAFGLLFLFHSWRPFDHMEWHLKNAEQSTFFDVLTIFAHGWRMYLIFFVSGAGTWLALRSRKRAFLRDRVKRLLVPYLFGILIIIPPQRFYEWIQFQGFEGSYLEFLTLYPAWQLGNTMGTSLLLWFGHLGTHLWFLPFLFVMTLISLPLLRRIQQGKVDLAWLQYIMDRKFGVFALILPLFLFRLLLKPVFSAYTDWADFLIYLCPFLYGFVFMQHPGLLEIIKKRTWLLLNAGVVSSITFLYLVAQGDHIMLAYLFPSYSLLHLGLSVLAATISVSWVLFFVGLFARTLDFNHRLLVPANISILPIYVLHQTLIIVFGYYIVILPMNLYLKFLLVVFTALPASLLLYHVIRTNNLIRFLFGLKRLSRSPKENTV
ncbi:MAG TPA: hypothetical protein DCP28_24470 [Cytophagales bacterium]|nr:hypothetical protein [Cytophagales bacterium]